MAKENQKIRFVRIEGTVAGRKAFVLKTPIFKKVKVKSIKVRN